MEIAGLMPPVSAIDEAGLLGLCQRMISLQSYTGNEGRLARELQGTMMKLGYDRAWIDAFGNVVGEVRGNLPGPAILFDGHIDTVDVSDGPDWTVPPFEGTVREGRIYGRGASDMKCALAAMIYGAASLTSKLPNFLPFSSGSLFSKSAISLSATSLSMPSKSKRI